MLHALENPFKKQFVIGAMQYTLTKTEVSFGKVKKPDQYKTVKFNEIYPCFEVQEYFPVEMLWFFIVSVIGLLIALYCVFMLDVTINRHLMAMLAGCCFFSLYEGFKDYTREFRFDYYFEEGPALIIKYTKKTKTEAENLANLISTYSMNCDKSPKFINASLNRYGLLTEREHALMMIKIKENELSRSCKDVIPIGGN